MIAATGLQLLNLARERLAGVDEFRNRDVRRRKGEELADRAVAVVMIARSVAAAVFAILWGVRMAFAMIMVIVAVSQSRNQLLMGTDFRGVVTLDVDVCERRQRERSGVAAERKCR